MWTLSTAFAKRMRKGTFLRVILSFRPLGEEIDSHRTVFRKILYSGGLRKFWAYVPVLGYDLANKRDTVRGGIMSICDCFAVQLGDFRLPPRSFVVPTFRDNLSFPFTKVKQSKNNAFCLDCPTFQDGTHKLLRNVGNNRSTLRNVPEERISQHYSCFYSIVTFLDAVTTVVRFILFCGCLSAPVMAPLRTRRSVSEIILFPPCKVERI